MQAIQYLPCTAYSFITQCLQQRKKKKSDSLSLCGQATPPSKRSQKLDTSDRSERQSSARHRIFCWTMPSSLYLLWSNSTKQSPLVTALQNWSFPNKTKKYLSFWILVSINCFCILVETNPKALPSHFTHPSLSTTVPAPWKKPLQRLHVSHQVSFLLQVFQLHDSNPGRKKAYEVYSEVKTSRRIPSCCASEETCGGKSAHHSLGQE